MSDARQIKRAAICLKSQTVGWRPLMGRTLDSLSEAISGNRHVLRRASETSVA